MIHLLDYGAGNITSVHSAFKRCGAEISVVSDSFDNTAIRSLVIPGVGSFASAMLHIRQTGWEQRILTEAARGTKILGICLGMQILFEEGTEGGTSSGLGLIGGTVRPLSSIYDGRLPHIGWNNVSIVASESDIFFGIKDNLDFYHVHSYFCSPSEPTCVLATTELGQPFASVVQNDNILGIQFHPEKSQPAGLKLLNNIVDWFEQC